MAACARKKSGGMRWLILLVLLLTAAVIAMEQNLSQTMLDMAFARAYSIAVETINRAVKQAMGQGVTYEELIDAQMDAQGRVLIPAKLRAKIGLTRDIVFVGLNHYIEVWDAEVYAKMEAQTEDEFDSLVDYVYEKYPS